MSEVQRLIRETHSARERFLSALDSLSPEQAQFKSAPEVWSIIEITEHITRAEQGGINGMWKALDGMQRGQPLWSGEPPHRGKSIEQVVEETWKEKEEVPQIAAPTWGGPLGYWRACLEANQQILDALGRALEGVDLASIHYPHPISGPLDVRQRLEFLRFHLDRHRTQVEAVQQQPGFPAVGLEGRR